MPALPTRLLARMLRVGRPDDLEDHPQLQMVLQVLADAGQRMHDGDAVLGKQRGIADAGQLQQMRRVDRAGGEDRPRGRRAPS